MQTYLVGGAVRDTLLNRTVTERDWVVVGATPDQLKAQGFQQVGKDFPVFLHPETKEEYALARTERKTAKGYTGFETDSSASITLEDDLLRRDLTVNAMAMDCEGRIIDPYGGQTDLEAKLLRHVSPAFVEDPLRVIRVARFAARYHSYGFSVASETLQLMKEITHQGELKHLSPERVWKETARALLEPNPEVYIQVLKDCSALKALMPELEALWGVPNPPKWHPEIDTGIHTLMVVQQSAKLSDTLPVRFAALVHDLGKALTPSEHWPSHRGHETLGLPAIKTFCQRLKVPNDCRDLALLVCEFHTHVHRALTLKPATIVKVFDRCDAWRKPERFYDMLTACEADARGRAEFEDTAYPQARFLRACLKAADDVDTQQIIASGIKGPAIRDAIHQKRIALVAKIACDWH